MSIPSIEEALARLLRDEISPSRFVSIVAQHKGRCVQCYKPATGGVRCEKHAAHHALYRREKARAKLGRPVRALVCGSCGEKGHNRRTCRVPARAS